MIASQPTHTIAGESYPEVAGPVLTKGERGRGDRQPLRRAVNVERPRGALPSAQSACRSRTEVRTDPEVAARVSIQTDDCRGRESISARVHRRRPHPRKRVDARHARVLIETLLGRDPPVAGTILQRR